jgi:hypothetical protein
VDSQQPARDWTSGLGLDPLTRERMRVRVAAAEARRAADEPVHKAIRGEAHGEYDPVTGRFVKSAWRTVM